MCGIVGVMTRHDTPVAPARIDAALGALHHRGPDGRGRWTARNGRAGLGHVRLAIVGLDNGVQPINNEDGTVHIAVSGELYDHRRLRRKLERAGHRFSTDSDSEVALHLYEMHGPAFVERLRGEFAIILFDERRQCMIAARDRFGIKPLCFLPLGPTLYHNGAKTL